MDKRINLTGAQISALHDFTGGEADAQITVGRFDERPSDSDGTPMPAGLYAWFSEYPEEGAIYLAEDPAGSPGASPAQSLGLDANGLRG